jgi:hypothetical protein
MQAWQNFYVIVGSSAGALIGLQFVMMTLIANTRITRDHVQAGNAFATPTVVHFGVVLLLAAIGSAPWNGLETVAAVWGIVGVFGIVYVVVVARRLRLQTAYHPVFEDRLFHVWLPFAAYMMLPASAGAAYSHPRPALFILAAAVLLLLMIGIHNAWDAVSYQVFVMRQEEKEAERQP